MNESTLTVYSHNDLVAIETPVGVCFVTPQVAIEITVSLMRAALVVNPELDVDAISNDFIASKKGTVQ